MNPEDLDCSDAGSDEGWEEVDTESSDVPCLFCDQTFNDVESALPHCTNVHKFNLVEFKSTLDLDCYTYIKLINFIRRSKICPSDFNFRDTETWKSDDYLKMELADDPWILFDVESLESEKVEQKSLPVDKKSCNGKSESEYIAELESKIATLEIKLNEKNNLLEKANESLNNMRKVIGTLFDDSDEDNKKKVTDCVKSVPVSLDSSYFDSYADFSIHREMLSDFVRTNSYQKAMLNNSDIFKGKTVLDVGCGTGVLSMFAADAGADKVIGIDQSDIIYNAMDIIRDNGFNQKIELVKGRIEDTHLPVNKVDIIVSEWMGYFLLFEAMLDSVVYTRQNHLVEGGKILPNRFTLNLVGASDIDCYNESIGNWSNCYGYKMNCLQKDLVQQPLVRIISSANVVTDSATLLNLDMHTCDTNSVNFSVNFKLTVSRDCKLTCLVGYFDTFFDLPNSVTFSTGPHADSTHWKQTVFLLEKPVDVTEDQCIEGKLICARHPKEVRSLVVHIHVFDLKQKFIIS